MTSIPQDSIRFTLLTGLSLSLVMGACSNNSTSAAGSGGSPGSGGVVESGVPRAPAARSRQEEASNFWWRDQRRRRHDERRFHRHRWLDRKWREHDVGRNHDNRRQHEVGGTTATGGSTTSGGATATGGVTPVGEWRAALPPGEEQVAPRVETQCLAGPRARVGTRAVQSLPVALPVRAGPQRLAAASRSATAACWPRRQPASIASTGPMRAITSRKGRLC